MNTRTPLAAALLLMASSAIAGTVTPPNGGNFAGGVYTPGSMSDPAGAFGGVQLLGTRPDVKWARADCQQIPCKTALQQRMEDQKKLSPNETIVDMGDGESFGIIFTDDKGKKTISIDNGMSCGIPRPLTETEETKFAAQIAKSDAQKADTAQMDNSINGDNNGLKINADNTQTGDGTPAGDSDDTPNSGYQDGASLVRASGGDSSRGDSSDGDSSGDDSSGGGLAGGDAGGTSGGATGSIGSGGSAGESGSMGSGKKAIPYSGVKARQEAEAKPGYEFLGVRAAANGSDGIGESVKAAFENAPVAGRLTTPPTSSEQGKMQFGANGPATPDAK